MDPIFYELMKSGGTLAVAGVLFYVWRDSRKENAELRKASSELHDKVLTIVIAQTQAMSKLESSIVGLKDVLTQALSRMQ